MTAAILGAFLLVFLVIWCWGDYHSMRVALVACMLGVIIAGAHGWAYSFISFFIRLLMAAGRFVVGIVS